MTMLRGILDRFGIHYGWAICAACALVLFCTSGLAVNTFSVFQPFLITEAGLTNTESSMIITARSLMGFLSVFCIGPFYRRFSLRCGLAVATALTAVGFVLFGVGGSFIAYCIAGLVVGAGYGLGTMVPVAMLISRWFEDRRALAMGICAAATGLSTVGVPALITASVETRGLLPAFAAEAFVVVIAAVVCFAVVRDDPGGIGANPYRCDGSASSKVRKATNGSDMDNNSWLIAAPALIAVGAVSTVGFSHLGVMASSQGFGAQQVATAISVAGVSLLTGKVLFGEICDRASGSVATVVFGSLAAIGLVLLCVSAENASLLFFGMALYGAGACLSSVGLMTWAVDLSSSQKRDDNMRRFQLLYGAGGLFASPVPGVVADCFQGSYVPAYVAFAVLAAAITLAVVWLYRHSCRCRQCVLMESVASQG